MVNLLKRFGWMALVMAFVTPVGAFSLLGPIGNGGDGYQTPVLSYGIGGDYGAPKNLGEEYRLNIQVLYYSFDQSFIDYFGSNGVWAVDQAFAVFNSLTNVDAYRADLSEFPLDSQRINYQAQALRLLDVKSVIMAAIAERLGLAESTRWTWCLRERIGDCQNGFFYEVIMRNFDPVTWQPTRYVNGSRYTYYVVNFCPVDQHDAIEVLVDPLTVSFNAVADWGLAFGGFYSTLTRDDIGGLRYLWRTNNMNVENFGIGTVGAFVNKSVTQLLVGSNLTTFAQAALTNDAAALTALYPDLLISETQPFFTNVPTADVIAYFTNYPWTPAGSPATLVLATNFTTNVATYYQHTFFNVVTNSHFTSGPVTILTTNVGATACPPWSPPGSICTNITLTTVISNLPMGEVFILPSNSACGLSIVSTQLVRVVAETNTPLVATNFLQVTNVNGQEFSQSYVTYFTNHILVINPVACESNGAALMQGIGRVQFIRRDYDSLLGQFFYPVTSSYTNYAITNNALLPIPMRRFLTAPDIVIGAADLNTVALLREVIPFDESRVLPRLAGPGTVQMPTEFILNKVGPMFFNSTFFADEATVIGTNFVWASFDSSTNEPVVYPIARTIMDIENLVLMQVTPAVLPTGTNGVAYPATALGGQGGQPPYTWQLAPGSGGLPPGLTGLYSTNRTSVTITGTPTQPGTYDFTVRMTDVNSRFVDTPLFITINEP